MAVQSDTQRQDQERTHPRDNMSDTCFDKQKITERTIELVWGDGHVMRRDEEHILRKVLRADITGKGIEEHRKQDGKTRQRKEKKRYGFI